MAKGQTKCLRPNHFWGQFFTFWLQKSQAGNTVHWYKTNTKQITLRVFFQRTSRKIRCNYLTSSRYSHSLQNLEVEWAFYNYAAFIVRLLHQARFQAEVRAKSITWSLDQLQIIFLNLFTPQQAPRLQVPYTSDRFSMLRHSNVYQRCWSSEQVRLQDKMFEYTVLCLQFRGEFS